MYSDCVLTYTSKYIRIQALCTKNRMEAREPKNYVYHECACFTNSVYHTFMCITNVCVPHICVNRTNSNGCVSLICVYHKFCISHVRVSHKSVCITYSVDKFCVSQMTASHICVHHNCACITNACVSQTCVYHTFVCITKSAHPKCVRITYLCVSQILECQNLSVGSQNLFVYLDMYILIWAVKVYHIRCATRIHAGISHKYLPPHGPCQRTRD